MATFVLVHGAFHGAWCWTKLVPELERRGHRAVAFDLPGSGEDKTPIEQVTLDGYIVRVSEVILRQPEPVILVGHSLGGISITAAAEHMPDRVRKLVYLCAFILRDGESLYSIARSDHARGFGAAEGKFVGYRVLSGAANYRAQHLLQRLLRRGRRLCVRAAAAAGERAAPDAGRAHAAALRPRAARLYRNHRRPGRAAHDAAGNGREHAV